MSGALEEGRNVVEAENAAAGGTNKEQQEHLRHLQKEAFQLANYYFVFQGVIFTAFYSTSSNLKCHYRWIPLALSSLAGILNLCAISTIACRYKSTLDDIDKNATRLVRDDSVVPSPPGSRSDREPIAVKFSRFRRLFYVVGCMALFVAFFVITLIGSWKITCGRSGSAAKPPSPTTA